jgi:hypothetical protein
MINGKAAWWEGNPFVLSASDIDFDARQWHTIQIFHFNGWVWVFIVGTEYFNVSNLMWLTAARFLAVVLPKLAVKPGF